MNEQEIKDNLEDIVYEVENDDVIKTKEKGYISINNFLNRFGDADLDYDNLKSHENVTDRWKNIFEYWIEEGLIE